MKIPNPDPKPRMRPEWLAPKSPRKPKSVQGIASQNATEYNMDFRSKGERLRGRRAQPKMPQVGKKRFIAKTPVGRGGRGY